MIRKDIFKEVGKLKPSFSTLNQDEVNFSSIFIVPVPHKVHEIRKVDEFFQNVEEFWNVKNNSIEKDLALWDIKQYIKKNIFESLDIKSSKEKQNFIYDKKNLLLSNKDINTNKKITFTFDGLKLILNEIDLWIMDGNIAFFVYKIEFHKDNIYDINTISTKINRYLRDYKKLSIDLVSKEVFHNSDNGTDLIEYFMCLTMNKDKKSFLNVVYKDNKFKVNSDLEIINNSTFYAKTITALHINEDNVEVKGATQVIAPIMEKLYESASVNIGILEELSYLLGTTSAYDFDEEPAFIAYTGYVYPIIKDNGINIWKFWSGVSLEDSLAFFSINKGGSGIVFNAKTNNYFLYAMNLYVNIRLKYIESYLIDKDFINIDRILPSVQEIQVLKNHYIASQISLKFQPNYINNKINLGLKNNELVNEIENNLEKTLELTKYNTDIVFSIAAGLITLSGVWLNGDFILYLYSSYPYITSITGIILAVLIGMLIVNKSAVIKFLKQTYKKIKRIVSI